MTTTVSLINIYHLTQLHLIFPLKMTTFRISSLSSFLMSITVFLTTVTVLCVHPQDVLSYNWKCVLSTIFAHPPPYGVYFSLTEGPLLDQWVSTASPSPGCLHLLVRPSGKT